MSNKLPFANGSNGRKEKGNEAFPRASRGRFAAGNPGGPGNPHSRWTARLNAAYRAAVTAEDLRQIVERLVRSAKNGNILAAREILLRAGIKEVILSAASKVPLQTEPVPPQSEHRELFRKAKSPIAT